MLDRERYRPDVSVGLRSWIEPELAARLDEVLAAIDAEIVLSSDSRRGRELAVIREKLLAAGIDAPPTNRAMLLAAPRDADRALSRCKLAPRELHTGAMSSCTRAAWRSGPATVLSISDRG